MMEQRKAGAGSPMGVKDWKRNMKALARQIDDPEALAQVMEIQEELDRQMTEAVSRLLDEGYSYTDLARPTGITRQAMRQRWAAKIKALLNIDTETN